ncbi:MAG TPA: hypothetical protein VGM10_32970 [Actinocrinis sp.]|jgi:hypothetical protein
MAPPVQPIARLAGAAGVAALAIVLATTVFRAAPTQPSVSSGPDIEALPTPPSTVNVPADSPTAATTPYGDPNRPLCGTLRTRFVDGGQYVVQNDEYNSSAPECLQTDGNADFTVQTSGIDVAESGQPGAYVDIYRGCTLGVCSTGGGFPIQVSSLAAGDVTSSWSINRPGSSDVYDAAYDIWYNRTAVAPGQPNGAEVMVWLAEQGVRPYGAEIATDVSIGGYTFDVFEGPQPGWDVVSYQLVGGADSVTGLDVGLLTQDSVDRGYIQPAWYLVDVEAGFELWQGGAGLATGSFSVDVSGAGK